MAEFAFNNTSIKRGSHHLLPALVCLSAGLFFFYEFFQLNVFDVMNATLRQAFGLNATQLSILSSCFLWANFIFLIPAGFIVDRYPIKSVMLTALMICILGTLIFACASHYATAILGRFFMGIGNAFCFLCCVVLVSRWYPPKRQGFIMGTIVTLAFTGGMFAHSPMVYLIQKFHWRQAILFDTGLGVIIWLWLLFIIQDNPDHTAPKPDDKRAHPKPNFLQVAHLKQNWMAGLFICCLNLPIMILCVLWGVTYLVTAHEISELSASYIISFILIGSACGCPILGFISDVQRQRKPMMYLGILISFIVIAVLLFVSPLSVSVLTALFFLLGFFSGAQVLGYPLIAESNASHQTGSATAVASMIIMGGGALSQVLFGWLIQIKMSHVVSHLSVSDFKWAMFVFPIALCIALYAVYVMEETYCKSISNTQNNKEVK